VVPGERSDDLRASTERTTMANTITISGTNHARLAAYGLDDLPEPETMEFRNERPSGYGDDEGDWFATIEDHRAPDGRTYHVLAFGTHGNDHCPGASHYTTFTLYPTSDPDAVREFKGDVEVWEHFPETDPEFDDRPEYDTPETGYRDFPGDIRAFDPEDRDSRIPQG
jgi:hypothetical protein